MKKILLIDTSALLHRAKHSVGMKLSHQDIETGIMFGFFIQIQKLGAKFKTNRFIFALDRCHGGHVAKRQRLFPGYKKKRQENKTTEEKEFDNFCYKQFDTIIEHLKKIGFGNIVSFPGYEADDIIASFVINNDVKKEAIIISSDGDFYQLLDYCRGMFFVKKGILYTKQNLFEEFGVTPPQWRTVKELSGCSSDSVPGIPGVGETKAAKYITGQLTKGVIYEKIISPDFKETRRLARTLTELPYPGTPVVKEKKSKFDFDYFLDMCQKYGFNSFISNSESFNAWKKFFNGY